MLGGSKAPCTVHRFWPLWRTFCWRWKPCRADLRPLPRWCAVPGGSEETQNNVANILQKPLRYPTVERMGTKTMLHMYQKIVIPTIPLWAICLLIVSLRGPAARFRSTLHHQHTGSGLPVLNRKWQPWARIVHVNLFQWLRWSLNFKTTWTIDPLSWHERGCDVRQFAKSPGGVCHCFC